MTIRVRIIFYFLLSFLIGGNASADVEFRGSIKTTDGSTFQGDVMAPTPHRQGVLRFEYQGNPVDVKVQKISRITRTSKEDFEIELISGGKYPLTVENDNIYNTFSGPLILTNELGNVYIKPVKIVEIIIHHRK